MKVICKHCGGLIEEIEAIKMNLIEFKRWQSIEYNLSGFSSFQDEEKQFTQICQDCYFGKTKKEKLCIFSKEKR